MAGRASYTHVSRKYRWFVDGIGLGRVTTTAKSEMLQPVRLLEQRIFPGFSME
jgi:hypothetical protein